MHHLATDILLFTIGDAPNMGIGIALDTDIFIPYSIILGSKNINIYA